MTTRIGDYELTGSLPATTPGIVELEALHVLLPRTAIVRVAAHDAARQLMREACILEALKFPGVPRIYECGLLRDRRPWIAFEAIEGPTLADTMLERPLGPAEMLVRLRDLAEILHHAHTRGVAHSRLRPELIIHGDDGLYITGWGTAELTLEPRDDVHALGAMMAFTMAPPIARGIRILLERMTSDTAIAQPTAAEVRAEAIRLLEDLDVEEIVLVAVDEPQLAGGVA
jgi:serine/threonine protein kinase